MLPRGFIFANGALLRVQEGGSWLSSGSWNNEDVQYVYRNNWNCKRSNKRSIDPNQVFRYSEEDVPKIAKQVFHGTETCNKMCHEYWERVITECNQSGMQKKDWMQLHNINPKSFYR